MYLKCTARSGMERANHEATAPLSNMHITCAILIVCIVTTDDVKQEMQKIIFVPTK